MSNRQAPDSIKNRHTSSYSILLCLLLIMQSASADNSLATFDVFELSLEELLNVKVTTTSMREESPLKAPGVVTIITSDEIRHYGARTLRDLLDRVVNAQILGSHFGPHGKFSLRGVNQTHVDSNTLFLLNGRPMRDGSAGGYNSDLYLGFPISIIERIEIVRGPGSVLYGTNAVAGVLNIITKRADAQFYSAEIDVSAGSYGYRQSEISGFLMGDTYQATVALSTNNSKGDDFNNFMDELGNVDTYKTGGESYHLFTQADAGNFHINMLVTRNNIDNARSAFVLPSKDLELERDFFDIEYEDEVIDRWYMSMHYTRTRHEMGFIADVTNRVNNFESSEELIEIIFNGSFSDNWNTVVGWNEAKGLADAITGFENSKSRRTSVYSQMDYIVGNSKFIGGFQWNDQKGSEVKVSPRIGFNHEISRQWHIKLLYGEAFRSPYNLELFFKAPTLSGNPNLKPVTMKTYDVQLIHKSENMYHALALFHSKQENIIIRDGTLSPTTLVNSGGIVYKGIELESKTTFVGNINAVANFSAITSKDDTGSDDNTYAPYTMLKLGFSYSSYKGYSIAVYNSFFDDVPSLDKTFGNPAINPDVSSYSLLTANVQMDTAKLWGVGEQGKSIVSIYLDNLFGEEIYASDLNHRRRNNTIPHHWGRGAYVTYSLRI